MVQIISEPSKVQGMNNKTIEEFIGRVNTKHEKLSVAHMVSPPGWDEPFQKPDFDEITIVLRGTLRVEHDGTHTDVGPNQTILAPAGERVRYSNPFDEENEYWAICIPAFSPDTVHREDG